MKANSGPTTQPRACYGKAHIYGSADDCWGCNKSIPCDSRSQVNQTLSLRRRARDRRRYADTLSAKGHTYRECFEEAKRVYP